MSSCIEKSCFFVLRKSTRNPIRASLSYETLFICLYTLLGGRESVEFYREKLAFCTSKIVSEPHPRVIVARNAVHMFIYIARGAQKCRVLSRKVSFLYFKNRLGTPSVRHCRTKRCLYVYILRRKRPCRQPPKRSMEIGFWSKKVSK